MKTQEAKLNIDPVLVPFVEEADLDRANAILSGLTMNVAGRIIDPIIKSALPDLGSNDVVGPDDVRSEVVLRLVKRLQRLKNSKGNEEFGDFTGYVAATCYNVCWSFLRSRHPERALLKDRLRYALRHSSDLSLWQAADGTWFGGHAGWRQMDLPRCPAGQVTSLTQNTSLLEFAWDRYRDGARLNAVPLLVKIFQMSLLPIELNELVQLVAQLWGMREPEMLDISTMGDLARAQIPQLPSGMPLGYRVNLRQLWDELRGLPLKQRVALVLTLRDDNGTDGISLLGSASVASLRDISESLEIPALELAAIWEELPYDDLRVAQRLGITRQQVVNLRKSARKRLAYRLKYHER